ncbi:hypothetical protein MTO96_043878 [Rhipicephalus appendiculatus]
MAGVIHQLGLQVLNTGSFTFVRRTGRPSCTAIDINLASEGARYDWTTEADTWGSDQLPIVITPVGGRIPRTRRCSTVDWRTFRQQLQDVREDQGFLGLVAAVAQAATIQSRVPENHPVPDLRHLNLRAARRRAERRYLNAQCPEHRTLFNRVDSLSATRQPSQTAELAGHLSLSQPSERRLESMAAAAVPSHWNCGEETRPRCGHPLGHHRTRTGRTAGRPLHGTVSSPTCGHCHHACTATTLPGLPAKLQLYARSPFSSTI